MFKLPGVLFAMWCEVGTRLDSFLYVYLCQHHSLKGLFEGPGETARWLREPAALAENQVQFPAHTWCFTTISNFSSGGLNPLLVSTGTCMHMCVCTQQTHTKKEKSMTVLCWDSCKLMSILPWYRLVWCPVLFRWSMWPSTTVLTAAVTLQSETCLHCSHVPF